LFDGCFIGGISSNNNNVCFISGFGCSNYNLSEDGTTIGGDLEQRMTKP